MRVLTIVLSMVVVAFVAAPASAAVIFADNFNRANSNTVGNGWSEIEDDANDVAIVNNTLQLRDNRIGTDAAAFRTGMASVSTVGFTNIMFTYDWAAITSSENSDELYAIWSLNGVNFTIVATHGLGGDGSFSSNAISLGLAAENTSIFIGFFTDVSTSSEGAFIDNVQVTGIKVPEPATLALLGFGLAGAGFFARRRRKLI